MSVAISPRLGWVLLTALLMPASPLAANPNNQGHSGYPSAERSRLARALLQNPRVKLLDYHVSGNSDEATAMDNVMQTARGFQAKRSYYGRAPGGMTWLCARMLRAIHVLTREGYSFRITELAGGSHSSSSLHYSGVAFDIDYLNGQKISAGHPIYRRFMKRCQELGATEIIGPGAHGHSSHLHIAWPRPEQ